MVYTQFTKIQIIQWDIITAIMLNQTIHLLL